MNLRRYKLGLEESLESKKTELINPQLNLMKKPGKKSVPTMRKPDLTCQVRMHQIYVPDSKTLPSRMKLKHKNELRMREEKDKKDKLENKKREEQRMAQEKEDQAKEEETRRQIMEEKLRQEQLRMRNEKEKKKKE